MAYTILEIDFMAKRPVANTPTFATLADAETFIRDKFAKVLGYLEIDAENDAIDFITTIGGQYAVEAR